MIKILFSRILLILAVSCAALSDNYSQTNDTAIICYITYYYENGGVNYFEIIPIQFLVGLNAIIEAKKNGAAEYIKDTVTGEITYYVPNDYYIVEKNEKSNAFRLSNNVKIFIYDEYLKICQINVKEFMHGSQFYNVQPWVRGNYYPFEIAVEKGEVTVIQEIYVP